MSIVKKLALLVAAVACAMGTMASIALADEVEVDGSSYTGDVTPVLTADAVLHAPSGDLTCDEIEGEGTVEVEDAAEDAVTHIGHIGSLDFTESTHASEDDCNSTIDFVPHCDTEVQGLPGMEVAVRESDSLDELLFQDIEVVLHCETSFGFSIDCHYEASEISGEIQGDRETAVFGNNPPPDDVLTSHTGFPCPASGQFEASVQLLSEPGGEEVELDEL